AGVEVLPGQRLVEWPAAQIGGGIDADGGERVAPELEAAVVGPAVETRPGALRVLDDVGEPAIAAREDALEPRELAIVPAELDAAPTELAAQQRLSRLRLLDVELRRPLEGRVWLRREGGHAGRDCQPAPRGAFHASRQLRDADDVLLRLAGKADHEVEL